MDVRSKIRKTFLNGDAGEEPAPCNVPKSRVSHKVYMLAFFYFFFFLVNQWVFKCLVDVRTSLKVFACGAALWEIGCVIRNLRRQSWRRHPGQHFSGFLLELGAVFSLFLSNMPILI